MCALLAPPLAQLKPDWNQGVADKTLSRASDVASGPSSSVEDFQCAVVGVLLCVVYKVHLFLVGDCLPFFLFALPFWEGRFLFTLQLLNKILVFFERILLVYFVIVCPSCPTRLCDVTLRNQPWGPVTAHPPLASSSTPLAYSRAIMRLFPLLPPTCKQLSSSLSATPRAVSVVLTDCAGKPINTSCTIRSWSIVIMAEVMTMAVSTTAHLCTSCTYFECLVCLHCQIQQNWVHFCVLVCLMPASPVSSLSFHLVVEQLFFIHSCWDYRPYIFLSEQEWKEDIFIFPFHFPFFLLTLRPVEHWSTEIWKYIWWCLQLNLCCLFSSFSLYLMTHPK